MKEVKVLVAQSCLHSKPTAVCLHLQPHCPGIRRSGQPLPFTLGRGHGGTTTGGAPGKERLKDTSAVNHQAPLSMQFSRQAYCSGLPFPSPGALPDPGIHPGSLVLQADSLPSEPPGELKTTMLTAIYNLQHSMC